MEAIELAANAHDVLEHHADDQRVLQMAKIIQGTEAYDTNLEAAKGQSPDTVVGILLMTSRDVRKCSQLPQTTIMILSIRCSMDICQAQYRLGEYYPHYARSCGGQFLLIVEIGDIL